MRSLKYGFGAAAFLSLTFTLVYALDWYQSWRLQAISFLDLAAIIIATYLYLREIKMVFYIEGISFWKAVIEGMKIILTTAIITSIFNYSYFRLNEEKFNEYKSYTKESFIEAAKKADFPEQEIKNIQELIQKELTPINKAKENFISVTLLGLIFVLVLAAIVRKKEAYKGFDGSELKNN